MSEEKNHLGDKIRREMKRLGKLNKDMAAHFNMASSSLSELLNTGRLAKEKYQRLVDLNGRSLDWWFDIVSPAPDLRFSMVDDARTPQKNSAHMATDVPSAPYQVNTSPADHSAEVVALFNTLPRAEQQRFLDELRQKAVFYQAALQELIERQQLTASH
jgi:plasmid maintenance system antidote protein VapI